MSETTDVLSQAVEEIKRLRHDNEILQAKVDVMELFREALAHPPVQSWQSQTMQVDPLWNAARHLDDLIQADKVTGRLQGLGNSGLAQAQMAKQGGQTHP
jgi:hypothetical protein